MRLRETDGESFKVYKKMAATPKAAIAPKLASSLIAAPVNWAGLVLAGEVAEA